MWMPCNFLEKIRIRKHIGFPLEEYRLIGLGSAPGEGRFCYTFEKVSDFKGNKHSSPELLWMDLTDKISYWPRAFNNEDCYDISSLNAGEITLKLSIDDHCKYNRYFFDTKSSASGKLTSVFYDQSNETWKYTFIGADGLGKYFSVKELLIKRPFEAYADDPILS